MFDGLVGNLDYTGYTLKGKIFLTVFSFLSTMLLLTFMVAMFNNRYQIVFKNLDFLRRLNIIKLKNSVSFDPFLGGITTSFFPINIILLPFIVPILVLKNKALNDLILKSQYVLMGVLYALLALLSCAVIIPLLYFKTCVNSIYIYSTQARQSYKGEAFI